MDEHGKDYVSEICQAQKNKYCMISFTRGIENV
jgi:hypothetical protein